MGRPATRKIGAYTRAEIQKRYRRRLKQRHPSPTTLRKQEQRAERERARAATTLRAAQQLGKKLYGVLYVDPPWDFLVWGRTTGMDRHAANHYPVMSLDQLAALQLPAARDCVLYLWTTGPMLAHAMTLLSAWGFTYKTTHGWAKPGQGTGHIVRENLELLLVASRGNPVWPAPGEQERSFVFEAARTAHSEKPEVFAAMIARLWPNTPKLEMFARRPRPGWDAWGNEVEGEGAQAAVAAR
jgi:N6-adenosine-specific RNA methylase IME4